MKFKWDKKYLYWGITGFLVIAANILFYYFIFHTNKIKSGIDTTAKIFSPIIYGLVLAYLLSPIVNYLENKLLNPYILKPVLEEKENQTQDKGTKNGKEKKQITKEEKIKATKKRIRGLSVVITVIFIVLILYLFFAMVIPQLIISIQTIAQQFPVYVDNLQKLLENLLNKNPQLEETTSSMINQYSKELQSVLNDTILPKANEWIKQITTTVFSSIITFLRILWNLVIGLIISIYLLSSKENFAGQCKKMIYALFSEENATEHISNIRFINKTFGGYISGKLVDSLIIGLLCFIGMTIFQLPYATLISVIIGVTNIIPFFGPYIGAIPSTLLILMVNPKQALYFIIFILILQQFDGNFLGPKIIGDKTGLSSFWVIFSITVLGGFFGIMGMAIGVPIFAVIYVFIRKKIYQSLDKKGLSKDTEKYIYLDRIQDNQYIMLPKEDITDTNKENDKVKKN